VFSVTAISDSSISYLSNKRLNFPPVVFESGRDRIKDETARALLISKEIIDLCAEKIRPWVQHFLDPLTMHLRLEVSSRTKFNSLETDAPDVSHNLVAVVDVNLTTTTLSLLARSLHLDWATLVYWNLTRVPKTLGTFSGDMNDLPAGDPTSSEWWPTFQYGLYDLKDDVAQGQRQILMAHIANESKQREEENKRRRGWEKEVEGQHTRL